MKDRILSRAAVELFRSLGSSQPISVGASHDALEIPQWTKSGDATQVLVTDHSMEDNRLVH